MIYQFLYFLAHLLKKNRQNSRSVAIKVKGRLSGATIENNTSIGIPLLEAEEIKKSLIKGNKIFLPAPKEIKLVWRLVIDVGVGLIVIFIAYKLGWST